MVNEGVNGERYHKQAVLYTISSGFLLGLKCFGLDELMRHGKPGHPERGATMRGGRDDEGEDNCLPFTSRYEAWPINAMRTSRYVPFLHDTAACTVPK